MKISLFLILFLAFFVQLESTARAQFCPNISVHSDVNDYEYYRVNSYFIQISYLFNKMYGLEFPKYKLDVTIEDKASLNVIKNGKEISTIVVTTNQKVLFADIRNFEKALIKTFLLAENSIPIDNYKNLNLEWILSGTLRNIDKHRDLSFIHPDFPIVTHIVKNSGKLNYQKIITFDLEGDGILHKYFAEESQILIDSILKKKMGRDLLFEYVKVLQASGKYDREKLFEELLKKYWADFDLHEKNVSASFNEYLNKMATELAPKSSTSFDRDVEKYLYETEKRRINIGRKYYPYLEELEKQSDTMEKAWPELQKFLDENYPISVMDNSLL